MTTQYFYVHAPTSADKSNSVLGNDSPIQKKGSDETWLLTYTNGYVPTGGVLEYHDDKISQFDGKSRVSTNKMPDPFALADLKVRGSTIVDEFWNGLDLPVADRVTMHKDVDSGMHMLELGDLPAAHHEVNNVSTDSVFTSARKSALLASITAVLDDYPHLK